MDVRQRSGVDDAGRRGEILIIIQRTQEAALHGHEMTSCGELRVTLDVPEVGEVSVIESQQAEISGERDRHIAAEDALGDAEGRGVVSTGAAEQRRARAQGTDRHPGAFSGGRGGESRSRVEVGKAYRRPGGAVQCGDA